MISTSSLYTAIIIFISIVPTILSQVLPEAPSANLVGENSGSMESVSGVLYGPQFHSCHPKFSSSDTLLKF